MGRSGAKTLVPWKSNKLSLLEMLDIFYLVTRDTGA